MRTPSASAGSAAALVLALLLCACTTPPRPAALRAGQDAAPCADWLARVDERVARAGVADAQETRIAGHPHVRTSRFIAALAQDRGIDDATFTREALPAMRALDRAARAAELSNLPAAGFAALGTGRDEALRRTETCGAQLMLAPGAQPDRSAITVPDDYAAAHRLLGAYALTRHPFAAGVQRQLASVRAAFARPLATPADGRVRRYAPAAPRAGNADAATRLLDRHQPVFEKEVTVDDDLAGALAWDGARGLPVVQRERPAVYRQIDRTRYRGRTLTQLVYTLWFGARPSNGPVDLLAGHLDGIIWRVTVDAGGEALMYDTAHPCGCYHYFITTPRATPIAAPAGEPEWAFVPQTLPQPRAGERVVLRIATRTHFLERATLEADAPAGPDTVPLQALPQDALRALPYVAPTAGGATGDAATHSAYAPDGLVPGTERAERFLFWPMGIASAGQMRQWGRHATAFVGRRHFDDADLLEKRFVLAIGD